MNDNKNSSYYKNETKLPKTQQLFLQTHNKYRDKYFDSLNELQKNEFLISLNEELSKVDHVKDWHGVFIGINEMGNDAAISIDIGEGITVYAGEAAGISTLIDRNDRELFDLVLYSQKGDKILFTGNFAKYGGKLVQVNPISSTINNPKYLFEFFKIVKHSN